MSSSTDLENANIEVTEDLPGRWALHVNGVVLAQYVYGKDKKYLEPERWAKEALRKRLKVIDRNIERLGKELDALTQEKETLLG